MAASLTIDTRMTVVERDVARHDLELVDHENQITDVRLDLARIGARLAVYSTIGAFIGGGLVAALMTQLS